MKVHHLNCGSMRPPFTPGGLVCHVLLLETPTGLALVDTGFGLKDAADPRVRIGTGRHLMRPALDEAETAISQVTALGFDPGDVRDVVLTHFDVDHTGGLADFPRARVHLTVSERDAVYAPEKKADKRRYRPVQRSHDPEVVPHDVAQGDAWRGFASAVELTGIGDGVVLIGLDGHSRGHAAVAVDAGDHWVLHAGDAFYHHGRIDGTGREPRVLTAMERIVAADWAKVQANHERLADLWAAGDPDVLLVNSHDPTLLFGAQLVSSA